MQAVRIAAIGLDHAHVLNQVAGLVQAGGELVGSATRDDTSPVARQFRARFPDAPVRAASDLITDDSIDLIVTAAIPSDRAGIALAAMRAGKDVVSDKPGCTSVAQLDELRATVADTERFWSVTFSERFEVPSVARAGEIARSGAIGTVVQTLGLGPHREGPRAQAPGGPGRPSWFYDPDSFGGIITDIASHQIDQFLWFTGSTRADVVSSTIGNFAHPGEPSFQDFGEVLLRSDHAQGYVRVDWFTPDGLPTWGDGRLVILGTGGYIELRKYLDIEGRPGTNHLFWADATGTHHEQCEGEPVTYYSQVLEDVRQRTESACPQEHTFEVMRLALEAQSLATRVGRLA